MSISSGFGAGFGVILGIVLALVLIPLSCVAGLGGCAYLIKRADESVQLRKPVAVQPASQKPAPQPSVEPTEPPPLTVQVANQLDDTPTVFDEPEPADTSPMVVWGGHGYATYHAPGCDRAPKTKSAQQIRRKAAQSAGYSPCSKCNPDDMK